MQDRPAFYHVAQVCRNGHPITTEAERDTGLREDFCSRCGAATLMQCEHCNEVIRGDFELPGVAAVFPYVVPRFCHKCGRPYPWTQSKINAAEELAAELDELDDEDRVKLANSLREISSDSPATEVAALRIKKVLAKLGAGGAQALRSLVVDIASDAAKKSLGL